jgi:hypothetical protein
MLTKIPGILNGYELKQTYEQFNRNVVEIGGVEFVISFVLEYPHEAKNLIELERAKASEALTKTLKPKDFSKGGIVGDHKVAYDHAATLKAMSNEPIIPFERLSQLMSKPENRRRHLQAIVMMLHDCMANKCHVAAYYSAKPVHEVKDKFLKVLDDLRIGNGLYDATSAEKEIRFSNGSKIVFASSVACGDFHIVAPADPYIGMDYARKGGDYWSKYVAGVWNIWNP